MQALRELRCLASPSQRFRQRGEWLRERVAQGPGPTGELLTERGVVAVVAGQLAQRRMHRMLRGEGAEAQLITNVVQHLTHAGLVLGDDHDRAISQRIVLAPTEQKADARAVQVQFIDLIREALRPRSHLVGENTLVMATLGYGSFLPGSDTTEKCGPTSPHALGTVIGCTSHHATSTPGSRPIEAKLRHSAASSSHLAELSSPASPTSSARNTPESATLMRAVDSAPARLVAAVTEAGAPVVPSASRFLLLPPTPPMMIRGSRLRVAPFEMPCAAKLFSGSSVPTCGE
eukprot:scaffold34944_cov64-Phaeocystis_antarctica.AAC.5